MKKHQVRHFEIRNAAGKRMGEIYATSVEIMKGFDGQDGDLCLWNPDGNPMPRFHLLLPTDHTIVEVVDENAF